MTEMDKGKEKEKEEAIIIININEDGQEQQKQQQQQTRDGYNNKPKSRFIHGFVTLVTVLTNALLNAGYFLYNHSKRNSDKSLADAQDMIFLVLVFGTAIVSLWAILTVVNPWVSDPYEERRKRDQDQFGAIATLYNSFEFIAVSIYLYIFTEKLTTQEKVPAYMFKITYVLTVVSIVTALGFSYLVFYHHRRRRDGQDLAEASCYTTEEEDN